VPEQSDAKPASKTTVGNYFVANYPPFSFWQKEHCDDVHALLDKPSDDRPLGVYIHIPFCRKRCHFCYFRVYTDRNSSQVRSYLDAVVAEAALYAKTAYIAQRKPRFVYFGGGTPSFLSAQQLEMLWQGLAQHSDWSEVEEITFECEPGTLSKNKLQMLRDLGVTRLSLGIENFDPEILKINNRAHDARAVDKAYAWAREVGFPQINIDLIAGMIGETDENWQNCIDRTLEMDPDSITVYQMEIPYNTTIYKDMKEAGEVSAPVADWPTKRAWVDRAFGQFEARGYKIGSAYTASRSQGNDTSQFLYRDALWTGADLLGLGVASFSQLGSIHVQNLHHDQPYEECVRGGNLPIYRALPMSPTEQLIREFILQLKLGRLDLTYFSNKFAVDPRERFASEIAELQQAGVATLTGDQLELSREGLLRVDTLLPAFFLPEHRQARYA